MVWARYGCPWGHAYGFGISHPPNAPRLFPDYKIRYWLLAANIAIGLLAVAVLTFASKYLVRATVAGVRRLLSKPPPDKEKGPERASEGS